MFEKDRVHLEPYRWLHRMGSVFANRSGTRRRDGTVPDAGEDEIYPPSDGMRFFLHGEGLDQDAVTSAAVAVAGRQEHLGLDAALEQYWIRINE
ncbi:hypothetical protein [Pseudonocardia sp. HH130629-09]|uniref:hypothetical protein n=1 Tax=Pseudonocardia sp. HH130629-09 TaxID=1641402 RepID=UPI0006CAFA65|nr:hypothetical protein [Pseudonocardia sp. HH130629-09]ALE85791.1 hypothetical protein XF36_23790 [Pseudonocardia sp. HH130629-09]